MDVSRVWARPKPARVRGGEALKVRYPLLKRLSMEPALRPHQRKMRSSKVPPARRRNLQLMELHDSRIHPLRHFQFLPYLLLIRKILSRVGDESFKNLYFLSYVSIINNIIVFSPIPPFCMYSTSVGNSTYEMSMTKDEKSIPCVYSTL